MAATVKVIRSQPPAGRPPRPVNYKFVAPTRPSPRSPRPQGPPAAAPGHHHRDRFRGHGGQVRTQQRPATRSQAPTTIKAVTKRPRAGTVNVGVTTAGGTASPANYKFVAPPRPSPRSPRPQGPPAAAPRSPSPEPASPGPPRSSSAQQQPPAHRHKPDHHQGGDQAHAAGTVTSRSPPPAGLSTRRGLQLRGPAPTITSFTPPRDPRRHHRDHHRDRVHGATAVKFGTTTAASSPSQTRQPSRP